MNILATLTQQGFTTDLLDPANTNRLGPNFLIQPSPKYLVLHDTGLPGTSASAYLALLKENKADIAHLIVDDQKIIECIPTLTAATEQVNHIRFREMVDVHFMGNLPNASSIAIMFCYGGDINTDEAYKKLALTIACLCKHFKISPEFGIFGHHFIDPKFHLDPVRGLAYGRRSYDQLLEDMRILYDLLPIQFPTLNNSVIPVQPVKKIRTSIRVNLRKDAPSLLAPLLRTLPADSELTVNGFIKHGDMINGSRWWFQTIDGDFFWAGSSDPKVLTDAPGAAPPPPATIHFPDHPVDYQRMSVSIP
ncbi:MAG: peptidoglycan recognition family protein, partial [Bacteroidota bacterium]